MDRFLFIFDIAVFFFSLIFFVVNFTVEYDGLAMIISVFAMLNAGIAIDVSELTRTKNLK